MSDSNDPMDQLIKAEILRTLREPRQQPQPEPPRKGGNILLTAILSAVVTLACVLSVGGVYWWVTLPEDSPTRAQVQNQTSQLTGSTSRTAPTPAGSCPQLPAGTVLVRPVSVSKTLGGDPVVGICPDVKDGNGALKKGTVQPGAEVRFDPGIPAYMRPNVLLSLIDNMSDLGGFTAAQWRNAIPEANRSKDSVLLPTLTTVQASVAQPNSGGTTKNTSGSPVAPAAPQPQGASPPTQSGPSQQAPVQVPAAAPKALPPAAQPAAPAQPVAQPVAQPTAVPVAQPTVAPTIPIVKVVTPGPTPTSVSMGGFSVP